MFTFSNESQFYNYIIVIHLYQRITPNNSYKHTYTGIPEYLLCNTNNDLALCTMFIPHMIKHTEYTKALGTLSVHTSTHHYACISIVLCHISSF